MSSWKVLVYNIEGLVATGVATTVLRLMIHWSDNPYFWSYKAQNSRIFMLFIKDWLVKSDFWDFSIDKAVIVDCQSYITLI